MNDISPQNYLLGLSHHFTLDAQQLIESFLLNLQSKLDQYNIAIEDQKTIFNGIEEFIQEFVEDYRDKSKINFHETLGLIREIGSPSEIIQAMDLPIEKLKKADIAIAKPEDVIATQRRHCTSCNWPNYADSIYCENCGSKLSEFVEIRDASRLPSEITAHPNAMGILLSYVLLVFIAFLEGMVIYVSNPDYESEWIQTTLFPIAIAIMIAPAAVLGLAMGYLIERVDKNEMRANLPEEIINHPNAMGILLTYGTLVIIGFLEGLVIHLISSPQDEREGLGPILIAYALIVMIAPAIVFGLIFGYLIERVAENQEPFDTKEQLGVKKGSFIPQEFIDYPFIGAFLLLYLILIIIGTLGYIDSWETANINSFHEMPTEALIPAIIISLILGFAINRLYPASSRDKYSVQLAYFQKFFSLGIILMVISTWLFFIYVPIALEETEFAAVTIILIIGSFVIPKWLYNWNSGNKPSDTPYFILLRYKKMIEEYNLRKIRDLNFAGVLVISFFVISVWSREMTETVFGLPAWVAMIISLLLLLNGIFLMNYYSWGHINRFHGSSG